MRAAIPAAWMDPVKETGGGGAYISPRGSGPTGDDLVCQPEKPPNDQGVFALLGPGVNADQTRMCDRAAEAKLRIPSCFRTPDHYGIERPPAALPRNSTPAG